MDSNRYNCRRTDGRPLEPISASPCQQKDTYGGFVVVSFPQGEKGGFSRLPSPKSVAALQRYRAKDGKRRVCKGYSPGTRRRLKKVIWGTDFLPGHRCFWATLTSQKFMGKGDIRRCRELWVNRLRRSLFGDNWRRRQIPGLFIKEWQNRGALHLHVLLQVPRDAFKDSKQMDSFPEVVISAWCEACKKKDFQALPKGQSAEWVRDENAALGYLQGRLSSSQRWAGEAAADAGRVYGIFGGWIVQPGIRRKATCREIVVRKRIVRNLVIARARVCLEKAKTPEDRQMALKMLVWARRAGRLWGWRTSIVNEDGEILPAPPELLESRSRKRWYSLSFAPRRTQAQIDQAVALMESHEVVVSDEQDGGRLCARRECPRTSRRNPFSPASPPKSPEFGRISGVPSTLAAVTDRRSGYRPRSRECRCVDLASDSV